MVLFGCEGKLKFQASIVHGMSMKKAGIFLEYLVMLELLATSRFVRSKVALKGCK